jgi:hypothetical protein
MSYEPRSHYEAGDPLADALARQAQHEAYLAQPRGRRVLLLTDQILGALDGLGLVRDLDTARQAVFCRLADVLYPGAPIDVPDFRDPENLEAFRR